MSECLNVHMSQMRHMSQMSHVSHVSQVKWLVLILLFSCVSSKVTVCHAVTCHMSNAYVD